jgi:hypothetical protein
MVREFYSIRRNDRGLSICIPKELAIALGIQDMQGRLLQPLVKIDLTPDRSKAVITPANVCSLI